MKIIEIVFSLSQGGAERFVVDLSNELSVINNVVLITLLDENIQRDKRYFYRDELSENVKYRNLGLSSGFHFSSFRKIAKAINEEKPDIVHLHASTMPYFCMLAILLYCKTFTFVQTIHGDINSAYSSKLYAFLFGYLGGKGWYKAVSLSATNFQDLINKYPKLNAVQINNGRAPVVPSKDFSSVMREVKGYKKDEDTKIAIHVARCADIKDQRLLINAFNKLISEGENVVLLLIGAEYDSDLGLELKRISGNSVFFLGPRKNIPDYLLNSDFFCLSSKSEGMPISLIEASLAAIPMVSTPVCGAVDIIENGVNGYLSKDHTVEQYCTALIQCIKGLPQLKRNCTQMVISSPYTIKICAERYSEFFNRCISDKKYENK